MYPMNSRPRYPSGFSVLKLLVVITPIAVLVGGIFYAAKFAHPYSYSPNNVRAQNCAIGLASGINNFRSDYGRFPFPGGIKAENQSVTFPRP